MKISIQAKQLLVVGSNAEKPLELDSTFVSGKKLSRYANKRMQLESSSLIELQNSPMLRTYNFYSQNNNCSRIFPCLNLDGWAGRLAKV